MSNYDRASPNPAELLGSERFAWFLGQLREEFDYVLVDAPPVEVVSDPAVIAIQGDGVLLVLDSQNSRNASLRGALRSLKAVGANVLGTVINNIETFRRGYNYGGYGY